MNLCTGRLPKNELYCSTIPQLSNYPINAVPEPKWSWTTHFAQATGEKSVSKAFPILGNDRLGDCVVAGGGHQLTLHNGMNGELFIPSESEVVALYSKLGHGQDNGLPLSVMLQAMTAGVFGGQKIVANCNVDPNNMDQVKKTIQFLGGAMIGFATTAHSVSDFQQGIPWDDKYREDGGGHCVILTGWDDETQMYELLTWGGLQKATYRWFARYCDEVHAIVTESVSIFDSSTVDDMKQAMLSVKA